MATEKDGSPKQVGGEPVALEVRSEAQDGRRFSPSTARNQTSIADVFAQLMPVEGHILEIASGTGEHGVYLSRAFGDLCWTYTDIDPVSLDSQRAWIAYEQNERLFGPLRLDTTEQDWGQAEQGGPFDGLFCANMIHIAPFRAAEGLFSGAGRVLASGAKLCLYGPFARDGRITPSNASFSADLKRRNPEWGVRDLETEIAPLALRNGLVLETVCDMPANNLCVIFRRDLVA